VGQERWPEDAFEKSKYVLTECGVLLLRKNCASLHLWGYLINQTPVSSAIRLPKP